MSTSVVDPASAPTSQKKLELEAKQRAGTAKPESPKTVFDGSSIFSIDGGIPVDYEDGELKDEVPSSSLSHDSKPAAGTRRPREDDSDASSSKRPRSASDAVPPRLEALAITSEKLDDTRTVDSVRDPWMLSESVIKDRYGNKVPPNEIPLYVDNRIVDDAEAAAKHFEPTTNQRRDYYISLFHELRYWSSKKSSGRSRVPEWKALCQSWNQFVENFNKDPVGYHERIVSAREHFLKYSITSVCVHEGSVNANIPCVVEGVHCPHCPVGAPRISERDLTGYTTNRVPANVKELRAKLACTRQHPSVVSEHNALRNTAPRSVTPPVRGGLRTPSPFPERPPSGRFGETTYLEGDPIVSNEYENEQDPGSSSDYPSCPLSTPPFHFSLISQSAPRSTTTQQEAQRSGAVYHAPARRRPTHEPGAPLASACARYCDANKDVTQFTEMLSQFDALRNDQGGLLNVADDNFLFVIGGGSAMAG
ncbi:LOW QUALITY PROTEIN: hypothetical protein PHMEG_00023698 [Phytophthora megakarya]|uniref:Uncharacterized protein n=1 Tax=Phytophthora megakarya TaxID=4795 RepID=A0A225VHS7_9STRA|nr:LOW QUALITY PROTEIN: hypothetical protein PHMEG_00023698 [Phytophthora megakarya]